MENYKNILITGGAGFIGGHLVRRLLKTTICNVFNIDHLNYASDIETIKKLNDYENRYSFFKLDLRNFSSVCDAVNKANPDLIIHLAAETHVDRSLDKPLEFIESNVIGTFNILEATRDYFKNLTSAKKKFFRFHHISTDEVFGSLGNNGQFDEDTKYDPRSPYSASKASSDHLVRAWFHSYHLPTLITNCTNNYGPYQFPEKLIPLTIIKALKGENIPIYGKGDNIRDWLFVDDHIDAIISVAMKGEIGKTYCIGGNCEKTNKELVDIICELLDKRLPQNQPYSNLIKFVKDRPGHDYRYSVNTKLIEKELGWKPSTKINDGLERTVDWYINNIDWCKRMIDSSGYKGERLGIELE